MRGREYNLCLVNRIRERLTKEGYLRGKNRGLTKKDTQALISYLFDEIYNEIDEKGRAVLVNICVLARVGRRNNEFIEFKDKRKKE